MKLYHLRGAVGESALLNTHREQLQKILAADYHYRNLEKLRGHEVYSFRLNDAGRLLFAIEKLQGEHCIILLEHLPTHDYENSRFLRSGVLDRYKEQNANSIQACRITTAQDGNRFTFLASDKLPTLEANQLLEPAEVLDYTQQQWINLDAAQNQIFNVQLPALISGGGGSGKSSTCLALLRSLLDSAPLEEEAPRTLLYCVQSPLLKQQIAEDFFNLPLSDAQKARLEFKTYAELATAMFPNLRLVSKADFTLWYENISKQQKQKHKAGADSKDFDWPADLIYQEFKRCSGYSQLKDYEALSERDLPIPRAQRPWLFALYHRYCDYLQLQQQVDFHFCQCPENWQYRYQAIFADEAQDASLGLATELAALAYQQQILFCIDSHQNINGLRSIRPFLLQHLVKTENHIQLEKSFRASPRLTAVVNQFIQIKAKLFGGLSDPFEAKSLLNGPIAERDLGRFYLLRPEELSQQQFLQQQSAFPGFAVICPEACKAEVRNLLPQALLILNPAEAKGLGYPIVLCYGLANKSFFDAIDKSSHSPIPQHEPKAGQKNESHLYMSNDYYTAITRSQQILILVEPQLRPQQQFYQSLQNFISPEPISFENSSAESWGTELDRQLRAGNFDIARDIFSKKLQRPLASFQTYVDSLLEARSKRAERPAALAIPTSSDLNTKTEPVTTTTSPKNSKTPELQQAKSKSKPQKYKTKAKPVPIAAYDKVSDPEIESIIGLGTELSKKQLKTIFKAIIGKPSLQREIILRYANANFEVNEKFLIELKNYALESQARNESFLDSLLLLIKVRDSILKTGHDLRSMRPVHMFAIGDQIAEVEALCKLGADLNASIKDSWVQIIECLFATKNCENLKILVSLGLDLSREEATKLYEMAIAYNKIKYIQVLAELGHDINALSYNTDAEEEYSALKLAVKANKPEFIKELLRCGANINLLHKGVPSALITAILMENEDLVRLLLKEGASVQTSYRLKAGKIIEQFSSHSQNRVAQVRKFFSIQNLEADVELSPVTIAHVLGNRPIKSLLHSYHGLELLSSYNGSLWGKPPAELLSEDDRASPELKPS